MSHGSYKTPIAFKTAVEQRLRNATRDGGHLERTRQLLVFDRFLARVVHELGEAVVLKGGLVLELRLQRARTTKDIDLRFSGDPAQLLGHLQRAGGLDLGDYMTFEVRPHKHPTIEGDGIKYDGVRFRVECKIAGKTYARVFGVDVGVGDPIVGEPDEITATDWLSFAGIEPPRLRLYPVETHIAEKLHAFTLPRVQPNSRVKDLPDIALLGQTSQIRAPRLLQAFEQTFSFRGTHPLPVSLPAPPTFWRAVYANMAREHELQWLTLDSCYQHACRFIDPLLAGQATGAWEPEPWAWIP